MNLGVLCINFENRIFFQSRSRLSRTSFSNYVKSPTLPLASYFQVAVHQVPSKIDNSCLPQILSLSSQFISCKMVKIAILKIQKSAPRKGLLSSLPHFLVCANITVFVCAPYEAHTQQKSKLKIYKLRITNLSTKRDGSQHSCRPHSQRSQCHS